MQKIYINNFGTVKKAEIRIQNILVLIGEQASGKSTIAKLIYFFKSLSDEVFTNFYTSPRLFLDELEDIKKPIRAKFYDFFGSTLHLPPFEIQYFYQEKDSLNLTLDLENKLIMTFSDSFFKEKIKNQLTIIKKKILSVNVNLSELTSKTELIALEHDKKVAIQEMAEQIDELFASQHRDSLFVIAGRETTVSYETTFEHYLEFISNDTFEANRKKTLIAKRQTMDEVLLLHFLKEIRRVKAVFKQYGGGFEALIEQLSEQNEVDFPSEILQHIKSILKGDYSIDKWGEKIRLEGGQEVYLKNAASGQKEVIRILQDLVLCILENRNVFRVVEEPEAHLFPAAQKQLVELLVCLYNLNPANQLIITTHSPYILTVLNNLLFAKKVIAEYPENKLVIEKQIPKLFHIGPQNFTAYALGHSLMPERAYCESILEEHTGVLRQNDLDTVSDILGRDFNFLYKRYAQSIKKKLI